MQVSHLSHDYHLVSSCSSSNGRLIELSQSQLNSPHGHCDVSLAAGKEHSPARKVVPVPGAASSRMWRPARSASSPKETSMELTRHTSWCSITSARPPQRGHITCSDGSPLSKRCRQEKHWYVAGSHWIERASPAHHPVSEPASLAKPCLSRG